MHYNFIALKSINFTAKQLRKTFEVFNRYTTFA